MKKYLFVNPAVIVAMIVYLVVLAVIPTIIVYFSEVINPWIKITFVVSWYFFLISYFYFTGINKVVVVSDKSVEYRSFKKSIKLNWEEIVEVGLVYYSPYPRGRPTRFICFSKVANNTQIRITKFSNECIYMRNRRGLIPYLHTYWKKEIGDVKGGCK
ncbi:hypothetical protein Back11_19100 [Paenibacillus baekrokdamisoli]|uniref:Uncharacterized protein n=1 Tax=Paenibacillus baekrokdamisoli TaxID=1712516 RepID=A0A3G9IWP0_9BACL|nr:hypothetical protein [Paenibacillus baekrokdamisoli]MBB3072508.1 hypothetical protein [Paenibacillus baekrokdamisoli]BBH20565.1 hypothetical protein Back11_19100 [Paenibacillus baekrokdamisoli]